MLGFFRRGGGSANFIFMGVGIFPMLSGTGDSQRDSRESIRANDSQLKPYFYLETA